LTNHIEYEENNQLYLTNFLIA